MARKLTRGAAAAGMFVVVILAVALGYRAWRQHETARALAITTPDGIHEAQYVPIGGIEQYVQIRGQDRTNPVILFLHGGPGISMMGLTPVFQPWERYFTVVQWDQRGAGKTYGRNGGAAEAGAMTILRMTQDGLEVAAYLRRHLHKKKVIIVGHSWGTVLGLRMAKERPDLFCAYVGTGQLVDKQENEAVSFQMVLERAEAARDIKAIRELKAAGPPPYRNLDALLVERKWMDVFNIPSERHLFRDMTPMVAFAPNYSLRDIYDQLVSASFSQRWLYDPLNSFDARKLGLDFPLPFFVFEGDHDLNTPTVLGQRYLASIRAPVKKFVLIRKAGHDAVLTRPHVFLQDLRTVVLPAALADGC